MARFPEDEPMTLIAPYSISAIGETEREFG
jgi:hypothetical protein